MFGLGEGSGVPSTKEKFAPPPPSLQPPARSYRLRWGPNQHLQVVATAGVPLQILHHGQKVEGASGIRCQGQAVRATEGILLSAVAPLP